MVTIADNLYIKGILEHDTLIINQIYKQLMPMVRKMILTSGGNVQEAQDIFQDAILIVYRKIKTGDLELNCKFSTYFYAITKKLWIQELKLKKRGLINTESVPDIAAEPDNTEEYKASIIKVIMKHFTQLSCDCQKILRMHFNSATIDDIQLIMGYKTRHHTIDRKYRCKRSLIKRIINDPTFKNVKHEYTGKNRILS